MKKIHKILLSVLIVATFMILSCDQGGDDSVSISERIDFFEEDLNNDDYDSLYKNFHPDMESYDSYKAESYFDSGPIAKAYDEFLFGSPTISGDTASGSFSSNVSSGTYTATMKEDGSDNWKILEMTINTGTDYTLKGVSLGY